MQSGGGCNGVPPERARTWQRGFVEASGCAAGDLACFRGMSAQAVIEAMPPAVVSAGLRVMPAGPSVDGYVLPDTPYELIRQGRHNHIPFIIGVNAAETANPIYKIPLILTAADYGLLLYDAFGADAGPVRLRYPLIDYNTPRDAWIAVTSDYQYICPARTVSRAAASAQQEPVYRYLYSHVMEGTAQSAQAGAAHGLELYFVFQKLDQINGYPPTAGDYALERALLGYWTRFARAGDPNGGGAASWPKYAPAADPHLDLDIPLGTGQGASRTQCDLWDELGAAAP
jgi:para-nitrobenzyl esterase